jgi:hypothetical protein
MVSGANNEEEVRISHINVLADDEVQLKVLYPECQRSPIFWEVGGLERGPLTLVRTIEELLEWKRSGSRLENWD